MNWKKIYPGFVINSSTHVGAMKKLFSWSFHGHGSLVETRVKIYHFGYTFAEVTGEHGVHDITSGH